jgi:membrane protein YdbS with pleckstrin-like domain
MKLYMKGCHRPIAPFVWSAGLLLFWFFEGRMPDLLAILGPGTAFFLLFGVWLLEEIKGFPRRGFAVREHDVSYRFGWMYQNVITVPFSRIQHSEIVQGPVSRWFGICNLKIYTAGSAGTNLRIPGLESEVAKQLRQVIDERTGS